MINTTKEREHRELCLQRDKEFLALYNPTLDALIEQGVRSLRRQGLSVECAINHVLEHCRASRFFITPATALTKICPQSRNRAMR